VGCGAERLHSVDRPTLILDILRLKRSTRGRIFSRRSGTQARFCGRRHIQEVL